jgi:predicted dienelactone hydrolase
MRMKTGQGRPLHPVLGLAALAVAIGLSASCSSGSNSNNQSGDAGGSDATSSSSSGSDSGSGSGSGSESGSDSGSIDSGSSSGGVVCDAGTTTCNGQCADTQTDPSNCGGCGVTCTGSLHCIGGTCQCTQNSDCYDGTCSAGQCFLELPAPTGPYAVGTQVREMVDTSRTDPQAPDPNTYRTLMVQLYYPADATDAGQVAPYLSDPEVAWLQTWGQTGWSSSLPSGWAGRVAQQALESVPVASGSTRFPVVLFSHGLTMIRSIYDAIVADLVSHGFVVVAISHTYDSGVVVFPDASTGLNVAWEGDAALSAVGPLNAYDTHIAVWVADASFVLDQVTLLDQSDPQNLFTGRLDLANVGMFGHSYGGATSAEVCALDPRFKAGMNLDGTFFSPLRPVGGRPIPTPFMMQLNTDHGLGQNGDPTIRNTYELLQDAGYAVQIGGSQHLAFSDLQLLYDAFDGVGTAPYTFGTEDPLRMLTIVDAYTLAFFGKFLQGASEPLLDEAPPYSEVTFDTR